MEYKITLNAKVHPSPLYFHGYVLNQSNTLKVKYLTRELVDAFDRNWISISPIPTFITPDILQVKNSTGGMISEDIPQITDFVSANNAISTLLEQQKRLTIDTVAIVEEANRVREELLDIQSTLRDLK